MPEPTLCLGHVLVRGVDRAAVEAALQAVMRRAGYEPWDAAKVPPRYPAQAGELWRWLVGGPDAGGTVTLVAEDWASVFARALELAKVLTVARLVAVQRPPLQPVRAKGYAGGTLAAKFGDDPDDELFYNPVVADGAAAAAFLAPWGAVPGTAVLPAGQPASPDAVLAALGVVRADVPYTRARTAWPAAMDERWFILRRSRLFLEA